MAEPKYFVKLIFLVFLYTEKVKNNSEQCFWTFPKENQVLCFVGLSKNGLKWKYLWLFNIQLKLPDILDLKWKSKMLTANQSSVFFNL